MSVGLTSLESERAALACALDAAADDEHGREAVRAVCALPDDAWTLPNALGIVGAMRSLVAAGAEVVTIPALAELLATEHVPASTVAAELRTWAAEASWGTGRHHVARVRQAHENRLVSSKLMELQAAIADTRVDAHAAARVVVRELAEFAVQGSAGGFISLRDASRRALEEAEARAAAGGAPPIPTGCEWLDEEPICGLNPGDLMTVVMVSGHGKTALLKSILVAAAKCGTGTAMVSAEMTDVGIARRVLAGESGISATRLKRFDLREAEHAQLTYAAGTVAQLPMWIDDTPTPKIGDVVARVRALVQRHPEVKLVGVDYVQLIQGDGDDDNRARELEKVSGALKALAKEQHIAVIQLAQPDAKTVERRDITRQMPELADVAWSQAIRNFSDLVLCGFRPGLAASRTTETPQQSDRTGVFKWAKVRDGALSDFALSWHGPTTSYSTHSPRVEPAYTDWTAP